MLLCITMAVLFFFPCQHPTPDELNLDKPSTFHVVPVGTPPECARTGRVHIGTVTGRVCVGTVTGGCVDINLGVVLVEPIWDLWCSYAFSSPKVTFSPPSSTNAYHYFVWF